MESVKFEVGEKYENMKGAYEVLSIDRKTMRIRWDSGEEITTTMSQQSRIITRMEREREQEQQKRKKAK